MVQRSIEERVSALEDTIAVLVTGAASQKKDWKSAVGMFEGILSSQRFKRNDAKSVKPSDAQRSRNPNPDPARHVIGKFVSPLCRSSEGLGK
jgi:hypothetical protein